MCAIACYQFPAVKGIQAGMEYYISMVPLEILPKLFMFTEEDLPSEIRAQRVINKNRVPEIKDYILENIDSYVFSALTVSVDGEVNFTTSDEDKNSQVGTITIPMSARFLINDGQHRKAAIEAAIKQNSMLKYEDISVVFFRDLGLKRSQQIFSDLNRYAIRPTKSLNILFDHRDNFSSMICEMVDELYCFKGWVEKERSTIPNRSKALFTLSGIYHGTESMFHELKDIDLSGQKKIIYGFWTTVADNMCDWQDVFNHHKKSSELRKESVSAHSITLIALGRVGNQLLKTNNKKSFKVLEKLPNIDWAKINPLWDGTVVVSGHISGTRSSTQFLTDTIAEILNK